jgi:hypothetical protein
MDEFENIAAMKSRLQEQLDTLAEALDRHREAEKIREQLRSGLSSAEDSERGIIA